jgi:hypothetical protein
MVLLSPAAMLAQARSMSRTDRADVPVASEYMVLPSLGGSHSHHKHGFAVSPIFRGGAFGTYLLVGAARDGQPARS